MDMVMYDLGVMSALTAVPGARPECDASYRRACLVAFAA